MRIIHRIKDVLYVIFCGLPEEKTTIIHIHRIENLRIIEKETTINNNK